MEETPALKMKATDPSKNNGKFQPDSVASFPANILRTTTLVFQTIVLNFPFPRIRQTVINRDEKDKILKLILTTAWGILVSPVLMHLLSTTCINGKGSGSSFKDVSWRFLHLMTSIKRCKLAESYLMLCVQVYFKYENLAYIDYFLYNFKGCSLISG